jgi:polysaccharide export outer membrane protein
MVPQFLTSSVATKPFLIFALVLASGLASVPAQQTPVPKATLATAVPDAPTGQKLENYVLRAGDLIEIKVFREENLTTKTQISQDGGITFPLIGQVRIGGKTVAEAQKQISEVLDRDYLVNPQVSISLVSYAKRRITILGQVQKPGSYTLPDEESLDVVEAIGLAGGYGQYAAESKIILKRIVNGKEVIHRLNARDMSLGKKERFLVLPGDVITVGESIF